MNENTKYFMIITSLEDYLMDVKNEFKFIGLSERHKNSMKKFNLGDKIIFYITKISSFAAVVEVSGEYFYDRKQIWSDPYDVWPNRRVCKSIIYSKNIDDMVFIKAIWDELDMIKKKGKLSGQLQGSFRNITENDYNIVLNALLNKKCNPDL